MKKRTFIALNLPKSVKDELAQLINQAKKFNPSRVLRYVKPQGIHITLHFLGLLNESQIAEIEKILRITVPQYPKVILETTVLDAFPNLKNPRVIILKTRQTEGGDLQNLQKKLAEKLPDLGLEVDHRAWSPHLTLARVKGHCQFFTERLAGPKLKIPINSVELMSSRLTPSGAEYQIISSYNLK